MTDAKNRILARRARFMRAAIASAGLTATAVLSISQEGCGGDVEETPGQLEDATASDTGPTVCLSDTGAPMDDTASPEVCLIAAPDSALPDMSVQDTQDSGAQDSAAQDDAFDTGPEPCLFAPLDSGPAPCLKFAPDSGSD